MARALKLAKWAANFSRSPNENVDDTREFTTAVAAAAAEITESSSSTALPSLDTSNAHSFDEHGDESRFEAPLLELQDALATLTGARDKESFLGQASEFDGPVTDLQNALSRLGHLAPPRLPEPTRTPGDALPDGGDAAASDDGVVTDAFSMPLADLQDVLTRINGGGARRGVDADVDASSGGLGFGDALAAPHESGAAAKLEVPKGMVAHSVSQAAEPHSGTHRQLLKPLVAGPMSVPLPSAETVEAVSGDSNERFLLPFAGPLSAPLSTAQAVIRRKYGPGGLAGGSALT